MSQAINDQSLEFPCSLRTLARIFDVSRDFITSRIIAEPSGTQGGHPVYRLKDVSIFTGGQVHTDLVGVDPESLPPDQKVLHWKSEDYKQAAAIKERRNQVEARELIPAIEVETGTAKAFKVIATLLDTLPDVLERDAGISPQAIIKATSIIDSARERLHRDLLKLAGEIGETDC